MTKTGEKPNQAKMVGKTNTISLEYLEIYDLLADCWKKGCSFRLLSALVRTKRYDTIYDALVRGNAFPGIKRSRPSREECGNIAEISSNILMVMEKHNITVRKWCQAYHVDHCDLWSHINPDWSEGNVALLLKEDFPELFGLNLPEYISAPVGNDLIKSYNPKKGRHVFLSNYYNIRVEHHKESEGLRIYNWRKSQAVVKRRLQLLHEKGIEAALAWPPSALKVTNSHTGVKNWVLIPESEEVEFQRKMSDILKRDGEINVLIRKLVALPSRVMTNDQIAQEYNMRLVLVKTYGVTPEQIDNEVKRLRLKEGRY